jgi:hypothetical protein
MHRGEAEKDCARVGMNGAHQRKQLIHNGKRQQIERLNRHSILGSDEIAHHSPFNRAASNARSHDGLFLVRVVSVERVT